MLTVAVSCRLCPCTVPETHHTQVTSRGMAVLTVHLSHLAHTIPTMVDR